MCKVIIIIFSVIFGLLPIEASQEFTGPWRGNEREILHEALTPLTAVAASRIESRFKTPGGEIPLEQKLWLIVDFLVADQGRNYGSSYCEQLFSTIASEPVTSDYSVRSAQTLATTLFESVEAVTLPDPEDSSEKIFVTGGAFGDEIIATTEHAHESAQRIRSVCDVLYGCLNILMKHDNEAGRRLAQKLTASRHDNVALVGRAFMAVSEAPTGGEQNAAGQPATRLESK
jgi:hypothetical protein